jgi:hypothetical protein
MPKVVSCNTDPALSDVALRCHLAEVAQMAGADGDWQLAEAFIALAYATAGVQYDDAPVLDDAA